MNSFTKSLFLISIITSSFSVKCQDFIDWSKEDVINSFELDSLFIEENKNSNTFLITTDTLNSAFLELKFENDVCSEFKYIFSCEKCYDCYSFNLTEGYHSNWIQYNDSIYYNKKGHLGWHENKEKEHTVLQMILHTDTATNACLTATCTHEYIDKKKFEKIFLDQKIKKTKRKNLNGKWKIVPNSTYPTEILTLNIDRKEAIIDFIDKRDNTYYTEIYDIEWIDSNVFQFLWLDPMPSDSEIYLITQIEQLSEDELIVWFYTPCEKFHQTLKRIKE